MKRKEFMITSAAGLVGVGLAGYSSGSDIRKVEQEDTIQYRILGRTGLRVTAVGCGAARSDDPTVLKRVVDSGVNFLATGRLYSKGRNEEMIGKVIKDIRKNIIIESQFRLSDDSKVIEKSIEESLKALQTDYIDIMLVHNADNSGVKPVDIESPAILEALGNAKKSGKIRFCGISCHLQAEMLREVMKSKFYDVVMFPYTHSGNFTHSENKRYSEWDQAALEKEMEKAASAGVGLVAMKTCSSGPFREEGQAEATYTAAIRRVLMNPNIATTVPAMGNFSEIEEDVRAMWRT